MKLRFISLLNMLIIHSHHGWVSMVDLSAIVVRDWWHLWNNISNISNLNNFSKAFWFIIFFYNLFCLYRIKSRVIFSWNIILYLLLNACSSPWKAECKTMSFLYPVECNNKWTNVFLKCHSACSLNISEINNNVLFVPKRLLSSSNDVKFGNTISYQFRPFVFLSVVSVSHRNSRRTFCSVLVFTCLFICSILTDSADIPLNL